MKMLRTPRGSSQPHKEAVSQRVNQDGRTDGRTAWNVVEAPFLTPAGAATLLSHDSLQQQQQ